MYGYDLDWDGFPTGVQTLEDDAKDAEKARENSPPVVLGEMALVLAIALGFVLATSVALLIFHIG